MRKINSIIILLATIMLSGCHLEDSTIDFSWSEEETTTFAPVNEEQYYGGYSQVNITKLEGLSDITDADIFLPIPNDAIWDAETKTYTMPENFVNENGESFVMTISLQELPDDVSFTTEAQAAKEEVESLLNQNRKKYSSSGYITESNVVVKYIKAVDLEEPSGEEETTEPLKKTTSYSVVAYDFLEPTYYLEVQLEIIKLRGTVDDTTDTYISAICNALTKFKLHYQED